MDIRNIAVIAHVDHGKTTMICELLKQCSILRDTQIMDQCAMDSGALEKERGITILAKCTGILWNDVCINIIDTPGHADFGGEVERVLSMVDGVLLLVDASEGPMPQTKFVTGKALGVGLKPIVVFNKIDKPDAEPDRVLNDVFDMFAALGANDEQLDFPYLYASGRSGWASKTTEKEDDNGFEPLLDLIVEHVNPPQSINRRSDMFSMLATILEYDPYLGRILTGLIHSGRVAVGDNLKILGRNGEEKEKFRVSKLLAFRGLQRTPQDSADSGDIVAIAGMVHGTVSDTLCAVDVETSLPSQEIAIPTISVVLRVNDSPLAGREGDKLQSRIIRDRLMKEVQGNITIKVEDLGNGDAFEVLGRGELQIGVLIETMRREGFELSVSRPRVLTRKEQGKLMEPIEEVTIDLDEQYSGIVVEKLTIRKGELQDMQVSDNGKARIIFHVPSRGLIGYHGEFLTDTRGTGVLNRLFHGWGPYAGALLGRRNGALISMDTGEAVGYALFNLEERGKLFVSPGDKVYEGMIIGEHNRDNDLEVNPLKEKKLTNMRAAGKDAAIILTPPVLMTLEGAIAYIGDDELVEVTPKSIRLRKLYLDPVERKRKRGKFA